ncbi:FERM PH-like domain protein [Ostertagia ostertagi]
MLVYDGNEKIGLFFWEKIQKLDFKNRKITLVVEEDADQSVRLLPLLSKLVQLDGNEFAATGQVQLHTFVFNLASHKACKHLWKCAIEHHTFFRLKTRSCVKHSRSQLFRLGSTFKYRGRTEYEAVHKDGARLSRRTTATFERRPSQRYGPRQSHAFNKAQIKPEATNTTPTNNSVPVEQLISNLSIGEAEKPTVPSLTQPTTYTVPTVPVPVTTMPAMREVAPPVVPVMSFTSAPSRDTSIAPSPPKPPSPPVTVPAIPTSSQHITMIPISAVKEKSPSPPLEKVTTQLPEPAETHPHPVQHQVEFRNMFLTPACRDHGDEPDAKTLTTSGTSTTSKSSLQADLETDLENVSPSLLTSSPTNTKAKLNTGIPKPSKIRPPTVTAKLRPTETNSVQEDTRISKIPKLSDGLRTTSNGQCAFSGTTHIPIRSGFDRTSQSRLITDL